MRKEERRGENMLIIKVGKETMIKVTWKTEKKGEKEEKKKIINWEKEKMKK